MQSGAGTVPDVEMEVTTEQNQVVKIKMPLTDYCKLPMFSKVVSDKHVFIVNLKDNENNAS